MLDEPLEEAATAAEMSRPGSGCRWEKVFPKEWLPLSAARFILEYCSGCFLIETRESDVACHVTVSAQGLYLSGVIGDRVNLRYVLCFGLCGSAAVVSIKCALGCVRHPDQPRSKTCPILECHHCCLCVCRSSCLAPSPNGSTSTTSICTAACGC